MKLAEIKDMSRYLENYCYCPGEIYEPNRFFFRVYNSERECSHVQIGEIWTTCICDDSVLAIAYEDGKIVNVNRIDATENNILLACDIVASNKSERSIDEFTKGATEKSIKEILSFCDAVIIS